MRRQHNDDGFGDYDDFDPMDQALRDQIGRDEEKVWKVQVHLLTHFIRTAPLPGTSTGDDFRKRFSLQFPPLPPMDTNGGLVGELRNLFDDDAYEDAQRRAESDNPNEMWFGAKFLHWRNEAFGRYCANTDCLAPLPEAPKRRGRPRLYCRPDKTGDCQDAALKRRKYHESNPNAAYRIRPMLVVGVPFSLRDRREPLTYRDPPATTDHKAPWVEKETSPTGPPQMLEHFSRWVRRHRKKTVRRQSRTAKRKEVEAIFGVPLEELVQLVVAEGYVFGRAGEQAIEELLGRSVNSLIDDSERENE
jgi:hypothetical protein